MGLRGEEPIPWHRFDEHNRRISDVEQRISVQEARHEDISSRLDKTMTDLHEMRGESRSSYRELHSGMEGLRGTVNQARGALSLAAWAIPIFVALANILTGLVIWLLSGGSQ
jgi:hypothetical protein